MRFATSRGKPAPIYARGNIKWRQWSSDSNAICNQRFKNRIELRTQTQPLVAKHIGGTIRGQNDRSRTRRTDEVPFIVGCSHFTRKNTRFGAPASSPKQSPCNIHAAITMRFATSRGKSAPIYARGNIKLTTMKHRFQCNLQPEIQEPHRTTHTDTTTRCKTHRRNNSRTKRPQPHPSHRRGTFHRRLQQLYTEKHKVSCSGFLPKTKPMQHSCSHYNAVRSINSQTCTYLRTEQHQNTKWQQSCSHSNAICKHRFQNTL